MQSFFGKKLRICLAVFFLGGTFLFVSGARDALALHSTSTYSKPYNGTLTSENWNNLLYDNNGNIGYGDFVNTWLPARMNGPLGIATSSPASGLEVNGTIRGANIFTFGNIGIGTINPDARLHVMPSSGYAILAGSSPSDTYKIGNVAPPTATTDVATLGWVNSVLATATSSITFWDGSVSSNIWSLNSGNVGIGTTNPGGILHVEGESPYIGLFVNTFALGSSSGAGMIGYTKHLPTAVNQRLGFLLFGSRGGTDQTYQSAGISAISEGAWTAGSSYPTYLKFETTPSGTKNRQERLRISANGNVGIGTTNPVSKIHISNNGLTVNSNLVGAGTDLHISAPTTAAIRLITSSNNAGNGAYSVITGVRSRGTTAAPIPPLANDYITALLSNAYDGTPSGGGTAGVYFIADEDVTLGHAPQRISFVTSETNNGNRIERLTIKSGGNVGIGTTNPTAKLHVAPTSGYAILAGPSASSTYRIGNVASPIEDTDVVTKAYVDSTFVPSGSSTIALFVGVTTNTYSGTNAGNPGYAYAHSQCAAVYPGSHVCTSFELLNTIKGGGAAPSEDAWIFSGPPAYTALANDCDARTSAASSAYGTYWQKPATGYPEGRGLLMQCNNSIRFACCL